MQAVGCRLETLPTVVEGNSLLIKKPIFHLWQPFSCCLDTRGYADTPIGLFRRPCGG